MDESLIASASDSIFNNSIQESDIKEPGMGANICHVCGAEFVQKSSLTRHVSIQHESANHICPFCGIGFTAHQTLTSHIKGRHESSPTQGEHVCRICGARFVRQSGLTYHLRRAQHESHGPPKLPLADREDTQASKTLPGRIEDEPEVLDLTQCSTPSLPSMERDEEVRGPLKHSEPSPVVPAAKLEPAPRGARSDVRDSAASGSSSPQISSHITRSAFSPATMTSNSVKSAKRVMEKSPVRAPSSKFKKSRPERLLPAPELQRPTPTVSVPGQQLPPPPEPQASRPKPSSRKNAIFHFYLEDENHGAIPQSLESCETMDSFFDEARAAWGALSEEQHYQPRMVAVKVIIEGVSRPIVVLWRNKEGFERMVDAVLEQAAGKQSKVNVEVRCFKRG